MFKVTQGNPNITRTRLAYVVEFEACGKTGCYLIDLDLLTKHAGDPHKLTEFIIAEGRPFWDAP